MSPSAAKSGKVVVVHRGHRDHYQVAAALAEANLLEALVTDIYWPPEAPAPARFAQTLKNRSHAQIPGRLVRQTPLVGPLAFVVEHLPILPFSVRRTAIRFSDAHLGSKAGRLARRRHAQLLSYSYYGYDAFRAYGKPGALFQLHPHPASVRHILERELRDHPDCAASLQQEWELALPEEDFNRLVAETKMASSFLVASSFTRQTLIDNGAAPESIQVVPYGVDLDQFRPAAELPTVNRPLQLLFVGTVNPRKGIKYLLEALRLLGNAPVELIVCGRVVDDLASFRNFPGVTVRGTVSFSDLQHAYQRADLFVLPSVAEGFGHVLLEALASGLPILSTTHTAAPDLVEEGVQGFVVPPRRPDQLAAKIEWALANRPSLSDMKQAARRRAEQFSWSRFRLGIVQAMQT